MKKMILLFLLTSGLYACFCDDVLPYWNVTDFSIQLIDGNGRVPVEDTIFTDSLLLLVSLETEVLANSSFGLPATFFVNQMWAFSCDDDGSYGMKDPWQSIHVYSDQDFGDIIAGEPLNDLVLTYERESLPLDEFVENSIVDPPYLTLTWWLTERPAESRLRIFTVVMEFESGNRIEQRTSPVYW